MALILDIWWPLRGSTVPSPTPGSRLVFESPRIVVGRGESCEVRLPDPTISSRHASIRQRGTDYVLMDEGSTNGTVIDGARLPRQTPHVLRAGDRIRVGRVWLTVAFDAGAVPTPPATARALALERVVQELSDEGDDLRPSLNVLEGPDTGRTWRLDPDRDYVIGRSDVDVRLTDERVARRHLEVRREGESVMVRDLGTRGMSALGERTLEEREMAWRPGVPLHVGDTTLAIRFEGLEALAEIERSPDQRMRPEDAPPFPGPEPEVVVEPVAAAEGATPVVASTAMVPATKRDVARRRDEGRWRFADFLVVLIALGVLTVSGAGIFYLMRSWT